MEGRRFPYPYDARKILVRAFPGRRILYLKTIYHQIDVGDNRCRISERPKEADGPAKLGLEKFDTIISYADGRGRLLVDLDKCSFMIAIEPIGSISQEAVSRAFRRMKRRGAIDKDLKTTTTNNGCEDSHQKTLKRILGCPIYYTRLPHLLHSTATATTLGCPIYYTRTYVSYEKGAI